MNVYPPPGAKKPDGRSVGYEKISPGQPTILITRDALIRRIMELYKDGWSNERIANHFADQGIVSSKTKRSMTRENVSFLRCKYGDVDKSGAPAKEIRLVAPDSKSAAVPTEKVGGKKEKSLLDLIVHILRNEAMSADDRIAFCLLVAEKR